jgi:hypothetical protein
MRALGVDGLVVTLAGALIALVGAAAGVAMAAAADVADEDAVKQKRPLRRSFFYSYILF